jgi:hypothetical protein
MIEEKRKGYNWHIADFVISVVTSLHPGASDEGADKL